MMAPAVRVLFDHQVFVGQRTGGMSRYASIVASKLSSREGYRVRIAAPIFDNHYLAIDERLRKICWGFSVPIHRRCSIPGFRRFSLALGACMVPVYGAAYRPHVVHHTHFGVSGVYGGAARVATVHDMTPEHFPQEFPSLQEGSRLKRIQVSACDAIICVSKTTAADLMSLWGVPREKLRVIPHGVSPLPNPSSTVPHERPYLLYVGSRGIYKDFPTLRLAYESDERLWRNFDLVVVGGGRLMSHERPACGALVHVAAVDDRELATWYAHAAAFVSTSRYEGFGLTLLEAMSVGTPVVACAGGSIAEVAGNAAVLVPPCDQGALRESLLSVLSDSDRRLAMGVAGRRRAASYSWEASVSAHAALYREMAS